jgi:hypothetical protein
MRSIEVEVAAIRVVLTHALSRLPRDELRQISENIHKDLQQFGDGGEPMAGYRLAVDAIVSNAANLSR